MQNVVVVRNFVSFHEFFQFRKQIEVIWSQDNVPDHTSAQALAVIQSAGFELLRHPPYSPFVIVLHGKWLAGRQKNKNSSISESELRRNAGPSAFQLQEIMLKSDKIWCAYLVVNYVSLRTFWTPLAHCVSIKRVHPFNFCANFPNCNPIQIIFGKNVAEKIWHKLTHGNFDILFVMRR